MAGRFGTDGIRGPVGSVIDAELALSLGRAVGHRLGGSGSSVLLGRDTRRSGEMLSAALAAGLTSTGTDAVDLGVVTTPCLVHASLEARHAAGIMVSASHNPGAGQRPEGRHRRPQGGRRDRDGARRAHRRSLPDPAAPERGARADPRRPRRRWRPTRATCARSPATPSRGFGSASTARTARPATSRRTCSDRSGRRSPSCSMPRTGRTSTTDADRPIRSDWRRRSPQPASRSASPSTATRIGSSRSTSAASSWTAMR